MTTESAMIGRTLDRYRILAKLGGGGMGTVWRAEHTRLGHHVALKLLAADLADSPEARQRLIIEAKSAVRLEHRNIARVLDASEADGEVFIVYQLIEGESLAKRCERGPLPVAEAVAIATDIAEALDHAHAHRVLHRDVTAGNVMVTPEGRAVLVDFGLARPADLPRITRTQAQLGTPGYVAPELLRGEPADARSDVYGLGAVLYQMLTGRRPFEDGPPEGIFHRTLNEPLRPPSELRPELSGSVERVVLKLLARIPADRYMDARAVAAALSELNLERTPSRFEILRRRWAKWWRSTLQWLRRLWQWKVGVAGLVSTVVIVVALLFAIPLRPEVLAVLPFENASPDPTETAYLAEGLGQELAARLGAGSRYRVLPWATTRGASSSRTSLTELASKLRSSRLLVGSFRAEDDRIRVTVSLVDGRTGLQLWSRAFDEMVGDIMNIQVNIAVGVASRLEASYLDRDRAALERRPTTSIEAYEHYLRASNYFQSFDEGERALAEPYLEQAIQLDPRFAEAYVGRGATNVDGYFRGYPGGTDRLRRAKADFERALALRPGLPRAERGFVSVAYETGQIEELLRIAERAAVRGDDDLDGLLTRGWALTLGGLPDAAVPVLDRVLRLDPMNPEAAWFRVVALAWSGEFDACLDAGRDYVRRFGEDPEVFNWMAISSYRLHRLEEASALIERALQLFGNTESNLYAPATAASIYEDAGRTTQRDSILNAWLPVLEVRHLSSHDNLRVSMQLALFRSLVGDTLGARSLVDSLIAAAMRPDQTLGQTVQALPGVAGSLGDSARFHLALMAIRTGELARAQTLLVGLPLGPADIFNGPYADDAGVRALRAAIRARLEELRRQYLPRVGLRTGAHRCGG